MKVEETADGHWQIHFTKFLRRPQFQVQMSLMLATALEELFVDETGGGDGGDTGPSAGVGQVATGGGPGSQPPGSNPQPPRHPQPQPPQPSQQPRAGNASSTRGTGRLHVQLPEADMLVYWFDSPEPIAKTWLKVSPRYMYATRHGTPGDDGKQTDVEGVLDRLGEVDHATPGATMRDMALHTTDTDHRESTDSIDELTDSETLYSWRSSETVVSGGTGRDAAGTSSEKYDETQECVSTQPSKRAADVAEFDDEGPLSLIEVRMSEHIQGFPSYLTNKTNTMVWRGHIESQDVIVKIAHGDAQYALEKEFKIYAALDAKYGASSAWAGRCVGLYHSLTEDCHLLVLRYLGPSLLELRQRGEKVDNAKLGSLLEDLASLHSISLRHNDVAERNVCFDGERAYLIDYGLCTHDETPEIEELDEEGLIERAKRAITGQRGGFGAAFDLVSGYVY